MCFDRIFEAAQNSELFLIDGGFCMWHLRLDGQLTIREIIATQPGAGSRLLDMLCQVPGAKYLLAKCPAGLRANDWYRKKGFLPMGMETTGAKNRVVVLWLLPLPRPER